jgi:hypothetical protein
VNIAVRRFAVLGLFPFAAAVPLVQAQPAGKPQLISGAVTPNPASTEGEVTLIVTDGVTRSAPTVSQLRVAPPPSAGAPKHP